MSEKGFNGKQIRQIAELILFTIICFFVIQNSGAVIGGISHFLGIVSPFVAGACMAFVWNIPMRAVEKRFPEKLKRKKGLARMLALIAALLLFICIIFVVCLLIIPQIVEAFRTLAKVIPQSFEEFFVWVNKATQSMPEINEIFNEVSLDWQELVSRAAGLLGNGAEWMVGSTVNLVGGIFGVAMDTVISFIFAILLLINKEKLARQGKQVLYAFLPEDKVEKILDILSLSSSTFANFLSGQCLEAMILGTMFVISMTLLKFPYAVMVGVLIAVMALIPIFGAFIGCFVGAFMMLVTVPEKTIFFIIMFLVLQQIEGNLIYPHVVGNSVGLPSIWVMAAVTVGGSLMGVVGMLIFIPICSIAYALFRTVVKKRLKLRKVCPEKFSGQPLPVAIENESEENKEENHDKD